MKIIATDGASVEPIIVNCLISHTGERYDFVVDALTNPNITEVFIRLRALPVPGAADVIREVARVIIVDDMSQTKKLNTHHLPLSDVDAYNIPYRNDIVRENLSNFPRISK